MRFTADVRLGANVAAVITTLNTNPAFRTNLLRIADQVRLVIIVDDSGVEFQAEKCDFPEIANAIFVRHEKNLGIAAALNRGVAEAESMGCDWVITLDDDTLVSKTYIDDVFTFIRGRAVCSLGLVSCARSGRTVNQISESKTFTFKRTLITSGCVFKIQTFRDVGGFDEKLFIDLVDFDFCTKLKRLGKVVVLLNTVGMEHRVGNSRTVHLLRRDIIIYNHAPFRLYYQVRNVLLFTRKHFTFDRLLCLYLLLDILRLPVKTLFFEQDKLERFFYLFVGLKDGLLNRGGRLSARFPCRNTSNPL